MTDAKETLSQCFLCEQVIRIDRFGSFVPHNAKHTNQYGPTLCNGSGRKPVNVYEVARKARKGQEPKITVAQVADALVSRVKRSIEQAKVFRDYGRQYHLEKVLACALWVSQELAAIERVEKAGHVEEAS